MVGWKYSELKPIGYTCLVCLVEAGGEGRQENKLQYATA